MTEKCLRVRTTHANANYFVYSIKKCVKYAKFYANRTSDTSAPRKLTSVDRKKKFLRTR